MAFFDDIGKKISEAGQGAVKKTQKMADSVKLNGLIGDEEKKIQELYARLGAAYYEKHREDAEEEFVSYIREINETRKKLEEYKLQQMKLKGNSLCPHCGAEISTKSTFCSSCGQPIPHEEPKPEGPVCSNCGNVLEPGSLFCTYCGQRIEPAAEAQEETWAETQAQAPVQPEPVTVEAQEETWAETPVQPEPAAEEAQAETWAQAPVQPEPAAAEAQEETWAETQAQAPVQPEPAAEESQPEPAEAPEYVVCPGCGAQMKPGNSFCTACGTRLRES